MWVQCTGIYSYNRPTVHNIFLIFHCCPCVILQLLVCHVAHGSQLVVSPLILSSRQTCSAASWCPVQWSSCDSRSRTWCLGAFPVSGAQRQRVCVLFLVGCLPWFTVICHTGCIEEDFVFVVYLNLPQGPTQPGCSSFLYLEKKNFLRLPLAWTMI